LARVIPVMLGASLARAGTMARTPQPDYPIASRRLPPYALLRKPWKRLQAAGVEFVDDSTDYASPNRHVEGP
jgi:hypothetical protein